MEEKVLSIINNYGAEHQQEKLKEEYELKEKNKTPIVLNIGETFLLNKN